MKIPGIDRSKPVEGTPGLPAQLLHKRYLLKDDQGRVIETTRQMFMRVAKAIAAQEAAFGASPDRIQSITRKFYCIMARGLFLPNSPTLMNAGRPDGLLSACFVLGIDDSIEGIFEAVKQTALVQKAGGGTGFAFDTLRPAGDYVSTSGGRTSGPISFWRVFAEATNAIQQGAHRRGANMGMMSIEHPDILSFISAKESPGEFTNFNISVKVPDAFMTALKKEPDSPHVVVNPRDGRRYHIPQSVEIGKYVLQDLVPVGQADIQCFTVRQVWEMVVSRAHATGEPGICFIDRVNRDNPTPALGRIEASNPCGEQYLLGGEACCLGSIDLSKFVLPDGSDLHWDALGSTVRWGVRFLDNVIDANHYPTPRIKEVTKGNRKIGLGAMGFADTLILLGKRYDSDSAVDFARRVGRFIQETAHSASEELSIARGSFPNWTGSIWDSTTHHRRMRNAACTTIAPTGSLSILAGCSAGIEPIYSLAYRRRSLDGEEFIQVHPLLERIGRHEGWLNLGVREALLEGTPISRIKAIPPHLAAVLATAHQVSPEWHIRIQAAFQESIDNAVSKTVNLPGNATVADVDRTFRLAFSLGCKGITVYRDGSRQGQTFSSPVQSESQVSKISGHPRKRGRVASGKTFKFRMGCGTLFVTVNRDEYGLCEVFANLGKAGGCPSQSEATCRVVSTALRSGGDAKELIEQLGGIRCLSAARARKANTDVDVLSCPDAIARAIQEALDMPSDDFTPLPPNLCPECGCRLRKEEGCITCSCGYSKCG